ncbi:MAG: SoxR reducing system RseC family protein [Bacteroidales bacterium]
MTKKAKTVEHLGKVQEVTANSVLVSINSQSACSACHAKGGCGMADSTEKTVQINKPHHHYSIGQDVKVVLKQSLGFRALMMGYVTPFLIVLFTLIILTAVKIPEGRAGLASLSTLIPYYFGLYILRDKVSKQFSFDIESV